jgi:serine protease Do
MSVSTKAARPYAWLAAACAALALTMCPARAQEKEKGRDVPAKSDAKYLAAFRDVTAGPSASVARVLCEGKEAALGTVVGADGWVLTKASELSGKIECKFKDGRKLDAKLMGVQEQYDLALLKVEAKDLKPIVWADSKEAAPGDWVASPGLGEEPAAAGVVSVATRTLPARELRQSSVNPNSGFLGVTTEAGDGGPRVALVEKGSAADKAGLKVNDRLLAVSGKVIEDPEALMSAMQRTKPGQEVTLKVKRGDEELELKATLGKRPAGSDRSDFQNRMGSALSNRRTGFPVILQHDTVLKPSDCGGPLIDLDGKAYGVNIARAGRVESYAVPSEVVLSLLPDLKSGKLAPPDDEAAAKRLAQAETRVAELKAALEKALSDKAAADKKAAEARDALDKAEADLKALKK